MLFYYKYIYVLIKLALTVVEENLNFFFFLLQIFDKGSFNYMDEVSLKKLSDDRDIIDDLLYLSNVTNHVSDGKSNVCVKTNGVVGKSNGKIFFFFYKLLYII